jgi:hypothetical protein
MSYCWPVKSLGESRSVWSFRGQPLIYSQRALYNEHDPNGPYDSDVRPDGDRTILFFPDVENVWFLIDPYFCDSPMVWFPAFGHDTSVHFPELKAKSYAITAEDLIEAARLAQSYPNARAASDPLVIKLLANLPAL